MNRPDANPKRVKVEVGGNQDWTYLTTQAGRRSYNPYEEVGFEQTPFHRQNSDCDEYDPLETMEVE